MVGTSNKSVPKMAIEKLNENGSETQEWWRFQNWCCSCGSGDQWETPESKKKSVLITIPNDVFPPKKIPGFL
jgi:hypothetical protein